jgi:hypothetical protein
MRRWRLIRALTLAFAGALLFGPISIAQNQVMGQVNFAPATKVEKSAGVWIDGQYVGHISELKGDKKIVLLPGEHEISIRQTGYHDLTQRIIVEPAKTQELTIRLEKDPRVQMPEVTPDRAAVFLDGTFVGYVHEFGGVGRAMLVSPGKHQIKIALPGYRDFTTEVNLLANQKFTLRTDLLAGSITQADPAVKKD